MDKVKFNSLTEIVTEDFNNSNTYIETALQNLIADFLQAGGVVNGLAVKAQAIPDMTVYYETGRLYQSGSNGAQESNSIPYVIGAAPVSGKRIDRLCVQYSAIEDIPETRNAITDVNTRQTTQQVVKTRVHGGITALVVVGVSGANPAPPAVPNGYISLAKITVNVGAVIIQQTDITDERPTIKSLTAHAHSGGNDGTKIDYTNIQNMPNFASPTDISTLTTALLAYFNDTTGHKHTAGLGDGPQLSASDIVNNLISGIATMNVQDTLAAVYSESTRKGGSARNTVLTGSINNTGNAAALYSDLTTSPIKVKAGTVINFANGFNGAYPVDYPYNILADVSLTLPAADANTIPLKYTDDLCNGGTAISDSDYAGNPNTMAFDNNTTSTSWATNRIAANQSGLGWVGYDFGVGVTKAIRKLMLLQNTLTTKWMPSIKIQYSDNGTTWVDALTTSATATIAIAVITVPAVGAHRYWRVLANGNVTSGVTWDVVEVEMYEALQTHYIHATRATDGTVTYGSTKTKPKQGKTYGSQITAGVLTTDDYAYSDNVAVGGAAISSGDYGALNAKELAFDGSLSGYWSSSQLYTAITGVAFIGYDFGVARVIRKVVLKQYNATPGYSVNSVKIQRSTDNATWVDVLTQAVGTDDTIILPSSTASRYWRVLANGNTDGAVKPWDVFEITMHEICTDLTTYDPVQGISRYFDGTNWTTVVRKFLGEAVVDSAGKIVSFTTYAYGMANLVALPAVGVDDVVTLGQFNSMFAGLLSANGWQKLPGGLIIQWGNASIIAASAGTFSFPITFPNACLQIVASDIGGSTINLGASPVSASQFSGYLGVSGNKTFRWIAIGN